MSTYQEAVEKAIIASEQLHQVINGIATTEITVEDGSKIPSVRKALVDNFYFKDPIDWQIGQTESVFNQLRKFTDGSWWYAPTSTATNPITMGATPIGDPLWHVYSLDAVVKLEPRIREALRRSYAEAGYTMVVGSFELGGTVATTTEVLLYEADGVAYSWQGALPKTVPADSTPASSGGVSASAWLPMGNITLRSELASAVTPGADLIGLPTGTLTEYLAQQRGIDPRLPPYNYKSTDSIALRTAALQAAFNDANATKFGIWLFGDFIISSILLEDHTSYSIFGSGSIQGASTGAYVLGIKNCTDLKGGHGIYITGPTTGYGCGVKVWASGEVSGVLRTCSLHTLGFKISNISPAWIFGDDADPDNLLSEIVIEGGLTYNVGEVARIIGSQAVIEFRGYQAIVATSGGTPFTVKGGVLHFNGGELQMPGVTNGYMVQLLPINSPGFDNRYGSCYINGTAVECASLWLLAHNPSAVPSVVAGSGKFVMDNCSGFANFSGDNLQSDSSFTGSVVITDTCEFHRTSPKPGGTYIAGLLGSAKVKVAGAAFDSNFNTGLQAYRPGIQIPQYGHRRIFEANNLSGQSFPQSVATDMKFSSVVSTGENTFYYSAYNPATGIFTVPAGGLKSVKVLLEFNAVATRPNSEICLLIDGAQVGGACGVPNKFVSQMFDIGDLSAGQTIRFRFTNLDTGFSVGTTNTDRFVISARTE